MSRRITERVCFNSGHDMKSLEVGKPMIDPVTKVVFYEKKIMCGKCGLADDQVQNYRGLPKKSQKDETT